MTTRRTMMESLWPEAPRPSTEGLGAPAGFRPARTPAETRAEETTRVAREMTDAEAERRQARTAELRRARLAKEATESAAPPVKAKAPAVKAKRKKA